VTVVVEKHRVALTGGALAMALHLPESPARVAAVVACHGLNASKDSDKYLLLGDALPAAGFALARFDFRGCGESSGVEEETTIVSRMEDVEAIVAFLARHPRLDGRAGLLGSSLGGFVALQVAARRPGLPPPPVVTWNAPASLTELANDDLQENRGLGVPFALEYATGRWALAPTGLSRHLIIHGDADEVVSLEHGVALHERAAEPCELVIIAGGDHRLTDPAHRRKAVALSVEWFLRYLPRTN
jgi:alpha-beta hydrolase superfamily lysophospholipase